MHPLVLFAVEYGPQIAPWLLRHARELNGGGSRLMRLALEAITDPTASFDRVGPALVHIREGNVEVLGLLHEQSSRIEGVSLAVERIGTAQEAAARSLSLLTSMSMVGLGVAALSQVHLAVQFSALTRRIKTIDARVQEIQAMLTQDIRAGLSKGIDDLQRAEAAGSDADTARQFTLDARNDLAGSRASYTEQLNGRLGSAATAEPHHLWMLARHLITAALGEAACHLRLNLASLACDVLRSAAEAIARHAVVVFDRTVGADPARFLIPATFERGLTLEAMAELYRQARHAGVLGDPASLTAVDLFERLRGRLTGSDPRFGKARKVSRLVAEFAEASAAVEEVNRLEGLAKSIEAYHRSDRTYAVLVNEILQQVNARQPSEGGCFAVFPDLPSSVLIDAPRDS